MNMLILLTMHNHKCLPLLDIFKSSFTFRMHIGSDHLGGFEPMLFAIVTPCSEH